MSGQIAATLRRRAADAWSSLRVRNYRSYFVGQSVSVVGTYMQLLATVYLTLHTTHSGTALGVVTSARVLPVVVLGPMGGAIVDRFKTRILLSGTQAAFAAGSIVFALLAAADIASYPLIVVLSLAFGCVSVVDNPARQSFIAELVNRDQLPNAVVLNSVSLNVARILGSLVGGATVASLGASLCFLLNALSFLAVLASLGLMRPAEFTRQSQTTTTRTARPVRDGIRYAFSTPSLAVPLLMVAVTGALAYEFPTSLPLLASGAFHGTAGTYGAMTAAMAAGAVAGGIIAAARAQPPTRAQLATVCAGWGGMIVVAALMPSTWSACLALAFVGFGSVVFNAVAKTTLQLEADPAYRGRVMALWAIAWSGGSAVGAPLIGWVADAFGSRWGLLVGGIPTGLLGIAVLLATVAVRRPAR